jgi:HAD superfamily hydrolase (TIGR01509 family)
VAGDAGRSRAEDRAPAADLHGAGGAGLHSDREALTGRGRPGTLRAVLFDWDGTLLDSAEASFRCYRRLFAPYGIDFTRELFTKTYAPDWYRTYEGIRLPRERWSEADARWLEIYREERCELVPEAAAALERLAAAGIRAALVTSGSRARVEAELARHGIAGLLAAVVCGEDAKNKKPHPEALHAGLSKLAIQPAEAAYVGDSPEDVHMARSAGVYAVGIEGAFPNREALRAAAPDVLAGDLAEAIRELVGGGG